MRTFRMIGMTLVAVLMCVNFASCSSDDDEPETNEEGIVTNEKKLVEMKEIYDDGTDTYTFSYDSKGHLISITVKEFDSYTTDIYPYSWSENTITETNDGETITYSLVDGLIRRSESSDSDGWNYNFAYNSSKQITASEQYHSYDYGSSTRILIWENGKVTKIVEEDSYYTDTWEITYGKETCKGYCPVMCGPMVEDDVLILLAHPELAGIRTSYLPTQIEEIDGYDGSKNTGIKKFSYTFDDDGYIKTCTEKSQWWHNLGGSYEYTCIYSFKWE